MSLLTITETAIFERIVLPSQPGSNEVAARAILAMHFSSEDLQQMQLLAEKARVGALSAEEQREIESYERVGHYLAILQSKARVALGTATGDNS